MIEYLKAEKVTSAIRMDYKKYRSKHRNTLKTAYIKIEVP